MARTMIDAKFILILREMQDNSEKVFFIAADGNEMQKPINSDELTQPMKLIPFDDFWSNRPMVFDSGLEAGQCVELIATAPQVEVPGQAKIFSNNYTQDTNYQLSQKLKAEYLELKIGL